MNFDDHSADRASAVRASFSVVDGGKLRPMPMMIAVDLTVLNEVERHAVERAERLGVRVRCPQGLRSEDRAAWLARCCEEYGLEFRNMAVVATDPVDVGMMLEAGVAYALETAGYDACVAADRVFCPRARGGLAQAIDAICELRGAK